jgi:two-component system response regulator AtoC
LTENRLREDLYHRLSAFTIQVPPLRRRKDEIATLLRYFMHNLARHYGLPERGLSASLVAACQRHSWPGNLRELEIFVKRYLVAGDESILNEGGLDSNAIDDGAAVVIPMRLGAATPFEQTSAKPKLDSLKSAESLKSMIQAVKWEAERNAIAAALRRTGWNRKAAARLLKVSYRTMLYKIEQYKMRAPQPYLSPMGAGEFSAYDEPKAASRQDDRVAQK